MSYQQMQNNKVYLSGQIASAPEFSHEIMGENFYDLTISVARLSGQHDLIPITVSDRLMDGVDFEIGNLIGLIGQFRSYNKIVDGKSKLVLRVFVREICECDEKSPNLIEIEGYVCKQPVYRTTPFKREIADLLIAVNRAYGKSDYIPCICWGRNARYASAFEVGGHVLIWGRIQSREYIKRLSEEESEKRVAYEVSVSKLEVPVEELV